MVTSFGVFKYMAMYSFIQFFGVLIMTASHATYADWQYFYADLLIVFLLAIAITKNETSVRLAKQKPPARLGDGRTILSVFLHLFIVLSFQVVPYVVVKTMPWYIKPKVLKKHKLFNIPSFENYSVVCVSFFQYIWVAIICSTGEPYRKPLFKNPWFIVSFIFTISLTILVTFSPFHFIKSVLEFPPNLPVELPVALVIYSIFNLFVFLAVDKLITCCFSKSGTVRPIKIEENENNDNHWPPFKH